MIGANDGADEHRERSERFFPPESRPPDRHSQSLTAFVPRWLTLDLTTLSPFMGTTDHGLSFDVFDFRPEVEGFPTLFLFDLVFSLPLSL